MKISIDLDELLQLVVKGVREEVERGAVAPAPLSGEGEEYKPATADLPHEVIDLLSYSSAFDDVPVVDITTRPDSGRLRVYLNEEVIFDGDPDQLPEEDENPPLIV